MRTILREGLAIVVAAVLVVCAALAMVPDGGTWASRFWALLVSAGSLSFGYSTVAGADVLAATAQSAVLSFILIAGTTAGVLLLGIPIGMWTAIRERSRSARMVSRTLDVLSGLPVLVWSTMLYIAASRGLGVNPRGSSHLAMALAAGILTLILGDRLLSDIVQRVRGRTSEVLAEPYMRTVRAGGFNVRRHLLQSIVPAVGEAIAARAVFLVSGAIVAERVFDINGLGFLVVRALVQQEPETPLVLAISMTLIVIGLVVRVTSRVAAMAADPRLRFARPG